ncbi:hypothetical protein NX794_23945 [Streptomyces sp. LP11]|uniref:Integral membrane protein n=1 Tax=Streptomyces pyxinicus TaxID=2970331 RepID=A0ABT2B6V2_9ACTN|nr:hypothetical protein [Streptomyces sp. LP11]MCS0604243.1 hypothetical protein [Streptomyces sp. LP11]
MLALRLTRAGRPAVQLRRLLVAAASAGTGFLLLACLGYALHHPEAADAAALRLAWCAVPLAASVYLALAVARTDPGTRPPTGLSALGLGPGRLMAVSALTTALSCTLGSALALLVFLHLRGDLSGMPFDGAAADFLAADQPLPVPAALTLLALLPVIASTAVALALRPRDPRPAPQGTEPVGETAAPAPDEAPETEPQPPGADPIDRPPSSLPWGVTLLAVGLTAQTYAARSGPTPTLTTLPGAAITVLAGWLLTTAGLVIAAPGLTDLCGRLLQSGRPGALRLLAGRILMTEAHRIGRPLGVLCAVAAAGCATTASYDGTARGFGPLTALGALLVLGCALATLLTAAVEVRQVRADTRAALLRLGAPATMLRGAAALRAAALLALFGPLTLAVAALTALPPAR